MPQPGQPQPQPPQQDKELETWLNGGPIPSLPPAPAPESLDVGTAKYIETSRASKELMTGEYAESARTAEKEAAALRQVPAEPTTVTPSLVEALTLGALPADEELETTARRTLLEQGAPEGGLVPRVLGAIEPQRPGAPYQALDYRTADQALSDWLDGNGPPPTVEDSLAPTPGGEGTAALATKQNVPGVETVDTVAQGLTDVTRGALDVPYWGASKALSAPLIAPSILLEASTGIANTFGIDTSTGPFAWSKENEAYWADAISKVREAGTSWWNEAAATTGSPAMLSAAERDAGIGIGAVELINHAASATPAYLTSYGRYFRDQAIDEDDARPLIDLSAASNSLTDRLIRVAVQPAIPEEAPEVKSPGQIAMGATQAVLSHGPLALAGRSAYRTYEVATGPKTTSEALAETASDVFIDTPQAFMIPLMDTLTSLSYDVSPDGQTVENNLGRWMRVGGSVLAGFATTTYGRAADKILTDVYGATSYRRRGVPESAGGAKSATWLNSLLPNVLSEAWLHDYVTTLENGDGFTTENMMIADTLAYGQPSFWASLQKAGVSAVTPESFQQGNTGYNAMVTAGMAADLLLNVDAIPGTAVGGAYARGRSFYDGLSAGRAGGMALKDAATLGAAASFPGLVNRALQGEADYDSAMLWAQRTDIQAQDDLARQMPTPTDVGKARATVVDAPTVAAALAYRFARRQGEAGVPLFKQDTPQAKQMREMLSRLGIGPNDVDASLKVSQEQERLQTEAPSPRATDVLRNRGWTPEQIENLSHIEAILAVRENWSPTERMPGPAPTVFAARPEILKSAESHLQVARVEERPPLGGITEAALKEPDPYVRMGRALGEVADHLGVQPNSMTLLAAFQCALSTLDPKSGRYERAPLPTPAALQEILATNPKAVAQAIKRLVNASPEQVFRNVMQFERGRVVQWVDEVALDKAATTTSRNIPRAALQPGDAGTIDLVREMLGEDHPLVQATKDYTGEGPLNAYQQRTLTAIRMLGPLANQIREAGRAGNQSTRAIQALLNRLGVDFPEAVAPPAIDLLNHALAVADLAGQKGADPKVVEKLRVQADTVKMAAQDKVRAERLFRDTVTYVQGLLDEQRPETKKAEAVENVEPARAKLRAELAEAAQFGRIRLRPDEVDLFFAISDRIAENMVKEGVLKKADDYYASADYRIMSYEERPWRKTEEPVAKPLLQEEAPPQPPTMPRPTDSTMAEWRKLTRSVIYAWGDKAALEAATLAKKAFVDQHPEITAWSEYNTAINEYQSRAQREAAFAARQAEETAKQKRWQDAKATGQKLPKEEWNQNFRRWFDGSVITKTGEPDGTPLKVSHETNAKFTTFTAGEFGFHFGVNIPTGMFGSQKLVGFLNLKNPYRMKDIGVWTPEAVIRELPVSKADAQKMLQEVETIRAANDAPTEKMINDATAKGRTELATYWQSLVDDDSDAGFYRDRRGNYLSSKPVHDWLRKNGYDGIVYRNEAEGTADSYIAFESSQFKSTKNVGTFDEKDQNILFQEEALVAPAFYSQLRRTVEAIKQEKFTATQLQGMLQGKVKPEEMQWTRMSELLSDPNRKLTKQEVLDHLDQNAVVVEEVVLGESVVSRFAEDQGVGEDGLEEALNKAREDKRLAENGVDDNRRWLRFAQAESARGRWGVVSDFMSRIVEADAEMSIEDPGLLRLQDMAKRLAAAKTVSPAEAAAFQAEMEGLPRRTMEDYKLKENVYYVDNVAIPYSDLEKLNNEIDVGRRGFPVQYDEYQLKKGQVKVDRYREILFRYPTGYTAPHFNDMENLLLHVRVNERMVDGKKTLFIEEIQSDLHQAGREGYRIPRTAEYLQKEKAVLQAKKQLNIALAEYAVWSRDNPDPRRPGYAERNLAEWRDVDEQRAVLRAAQQAFYPELSTVIASVVSAEKADTDAVKARYSAEGQRPDESRESYLDRIIPLSEAIMEAKQRVAVAQKALDTAIAEVERKRLDAPPPAPFQKFHEFALKRMIRWAAEGGYDQIAWTTGAQQVERYQSEVRQRVDRLEWRKDASGVTVVGYKNDQPVTSQTAQPGELAGLIGQTMANAILVSPNDTGTLTGDALTVGGEGMKGFYDKILVNYANDYTKKWGGRVTSQEIKVGTKPTKQGPAVIKEPVHVLEIPDAMRKDVLEKGQPLFQDEDKPRGRLGLSYKDVLERMMTKAANDLAEGKITREEYADLVDKQKPVEPYTEAPLPETPEKILDALKRTNREDQNSKPKQDYFGEPSRTLNEGDQVGLRLDIPSYSTTGTWVVTVHGPQKGKSTYQGAGKRIGYESVAAATDVTFSVKGPAALKIAQGAEKGTIATMEGRWKPTTPEEAYRRAVEILSQNEKNAAGEPVWVQVGMDPERHTYFYDRANHRIPIMAAEEVIQIGPLVLAKNVTRGNPADFSFQDSPSTPGQPKGAFVAKPLSAAKDMVRGIIYLFEKADLSTLFHENAHMFRRMLPTADMKEVDAFVQQKWGGWSRDAEEWFARQFEAYLADGRLAVEGKDNAKRGLLNRAFRMVAAILSDIYRNVTLPKVDPRARTLFDKYLSVRTDKRPAIPAEVLARGMDQRPGVPTPPTVGMPDAVPDLEAARQAKAEGARKRSGRLQAVRSRLLRNGMSEAYLQQLESYITGAEPAAPPPVVNPRAPRAVVANSTPAQAAPEPVQLHPDADPGSPAPLDPTPARPLGRWTKDTVNWLDGEVRRLDDMKAQNVRGANRRAALVAVTYKLADRLGLNGNARQALIDAVLNKGRSVDGAKRVGRDYLRLLVERRRSWLETAPDPVVMPAQPEAPVVAVAPPAPQPVARDATLRSAAAEVVRITTDPKAKPAARSKAIQALAREAGAYRVALDQGEAALAANVERVGTVLSAEISALRKGISGLSTLAEADRPAAVQRLVDTVVDAAMRPPAPQAPVPEVAPPAPRTPKEKPVKDAAAYRADLDAARQALLAAIDKGSTSNILLARLSDLRRAAGAMLTWVETQDNAAVENARKSATLQNVIPSEWIRPLTAVLTQKGLEPANRIALVQDDLDRLINLSQQGRTLRLPEAAQAPAPTEPMEPAPVATLPVEFAPQPEGVPADAPERVMGYAGDAYRDATGEAWAVLDSLNNRYTCHYEVVPVGSLLTSHTDMLSPTPGYDQRFQNRQQAEARRDWIEDVVRNFDPLHLKPGGNTVTSGPPTVWKNVKGELVVVAGNGRAIALRNILAQPLSPQAVLYRQHRAKEAAAMQMADREDAVLVRVLNLSPEREVEAITLAQNSQESTSVPQTQTAKILSGAMRRKILITDPPVLDFNPAPVELGPVVIRDMLRGNPALLELIMLGAGDKTAANEIFNPNNTQRMVDETISSLLALLPSDAIEALQRSSAQINVAIQHAMPGLIRLANLAASRTDWRPLDLIPVLSDALWLWGKAESQQQTTKNALLDLAGSESVQVKYAGRAIPVSKVSVALAFGLKEASRADADGLEVSRRVQGLIHEAETSSQVRMFGPVQSANPVDWIARELMGDPSKLGDFPDSHDVARERAAQLTAQSHERAQKRAEAEAVVREAENAPVEPEEAPLPLNQSTSPDKEDVPLYQLVDPFAMANDTVDTAVAALIQQNPEEGPARAERLKMRVAPILKEIKDAAVQEAARRSLWDNGTGENATAALTAYTDAVELSQQLRAKLNATIEAEVRRTRAAPPPASTRTGQDAVDARLNAATRFGEATEADARDARRLLELLQGSMEGAQFAVRKKVGRSTNALGAYDFANDILMLATHTFETGASTRTFAHEIGHRISAWLPKATAQALYRQYVKERVVAIKANPTWFDSSGKLTSTDPGAYRWSNIDEWFAERFADHAKKRLSQWDAAPRSVMDAALFLLEQVKARILQWFGVDRVPGIVEDLIAGNIDAIVQDVRKPLQNRLFSQYPSMDRRPAKASNQGPLYQEDIETFRERQVNSPEFKRWFGDSKVVDDQGKPAVVYHGSPASFDTFSKAKVSDSNLYGPGFYFASSPEGAEPFATDGGVGTSRVSMQPVFDPEDVPDFVSDLRKIAEPEIRRLQKVQQRMLRDESFSVSYEDSRAIESALEWERAVSDFENGEYGKWLFFGPTSWDNPDIELFRQKWYNNGRIYPVYLKISNPFNLDQPITEQWRRRFVQEVIRLFPGDRAAIIKDEGLARTNRKNETIEHFLRNMDVHPQARAAARAVAIKDGYDGFVAAEREFGDGLQWIAFSPTQIKSAIGNVGTFDPTNPSILYQEDVGNKEYRVGPQEALDSLSDSPRIWSDWAKSLVDAGLSKDIVAYRLGSQVVMDEYGRWVDQVDDWLPEDQATRMVTKSTVRYYLEPEPKYFTDMDGVVHRLDDPSIFEGFGTNVSNIIGSVEDVYLNLEFDYPPILSVHGDQKWIKKYSGTEAMAADTELSLRDTIKKDPHHSTRLPSLSKREMTTLKTKAKNTSINVERAILYMIAKALSLGLHDEDGMVLRLYGLDKKTTSIVIQYLRSHGMTVQEHGRKDWYTVNTDKKVIRAITEDPLYQTPESQQTMEDALSGARPRTVTRRPVMAEAPTTIPAGYKDSTEAANIYGVQAYLERGQYPETRERLNLALGYRANQTVYDAADLQARLYALATSRTVHNAATIDYVQVGNTTAVPKVRRDAVLARTRALLGDLPEQLRDSLRANKPDANQPIGITPEAALRVRILLDYLMKLGWTYGVPPALRVMPPDQIRAQLTQAQWNNIVGALHDAHSGVVAQQPRVDQYALGSNLAWHIMKKRGGPLTSPEREKSGIKKLARSAIEEISFRVLPIEYRNPNMPWYVDLKYTELRRKIGQVQAQFAEDLQRVIDEDRRAGGPGRAVAATAQLVGAAGEPIIDVRPRAGGPSDFQALRSWWFSPYIVKNGQWSPHDVPRQAPLTVNEFLANKDLVYRVLNKRGLDILTIQALERLLQDERTPGGVTGVRITDDDIVLLYMKLDAVLAEARSRGHTVLRSAAGYSGGTRVARAIDEHPGAALDAYEAWHTGRWDGLSISDPKTPSVEWLVQTVLGVGTPVEAARWAPEYAVRERALTVVEQFVRNLMDYDYHYDPLRTYLAAHPAHESPTQPGTLGADPATGRPITTQEVVQFSADVEEAVVQIMSGSELGIYAVTDKNGNRLAGRAGRHVTPQARWAARDLIYRWGLIPDQVVENTSVQRGEAFPRPSYAKLPRTAGTGDVDWAATSATLGMQHSPATEAEAAPLAGLYIGADTGMAAEMIKDMATQINERAPVGQQFAGGAEARNDRWVATKLGEIQRMIKRGMVVGGPNLTAAAAVTAGAALGGTVNPMELATVFGATFAATTLPRFSGFVTNYLGMQFYQMFYVLGAKETARTTVASGPEASEAAMAGVSRFEANKSLGDVVKDAMHYVGYYMAGPGQRPTETPAQIIERMRQAATSGATQGRPGGRAFVTADGRVYNTAYIVARAHEIGLDGTQANFESAQQFSLRMQQLLDEEARQNTLWGRLAIGLKAMATGDTWLNGAYQTAYNLTDTYFRYAILIQGLKDGLPEAEAVNRALLTAFDYSAMAQIDHVINRYLLFWMFTRRTLDLTAWTLVHHPGRVLGMIRAMRGLMAASGYEEYGYASENAKRRVDRGTPERQPGYAQGRPALGFIPINSGDVAALKVMGPEVPFVTSFNLINDVLNLDVAAMAGRLQFPYPMGISMAAGMTDSQVLSPLNRKMVDDPTYAEVPAIIVEFMQNNAPGFIEAFNIAPSQGRDGQMHYYARDLERWYYFKQSVPHLDPVLTTAQAYDRAGIASPFTINVGDRQDDPHDTAYQAARGAGARTSVPQWAEMLRVFTGFATAPISTTTAAGEAIQRKAGAQIREATQKIPAPFIEEPGTIPAIELGQQPGTLGLQPENIPLGTMKETP